MKDVFFGVSVVAAWHGMGSEFEVDYTCDQIARGSRTSNDH